MLLACLCIRLYVCLYVCLSISSPISKTTCPNLTKFSHLLPWLGLRPTRTHYIMYYRFYISEYLNCARGRSLLSLIAFFCCLCRHINRSYRCDPSVITGYRCFDHLPDRLKANQQARYFNSCHYGTCIYSRQLEGVLYFM